MKTLRFSCALLAALIAMPAQASDVPAPGKISSAEIDRMLAAPQRGMAMGTLPTALRGAKVVALRRTESGEAELHEQFDDIFVVRSGNATVLVGGTLAGNRSVSAGEWRGGTISGGQKFEVEPGDVLWIPAGLPHQVILPGGSGEVSYLAFKNPR